MRRLGIRATEVDRFRAINGARMEGLVGEAIARHGGRERHTLVVMAAPEDTPVMGLLTLETFGLEVDPVSRALRRVDAYLALGAAA